MGDITHEFVSGISDGGDASLVRPSNWNANHAFTKPLMGGSTYASFFDDFFFGSGSFAAGTQFISTGSGAASSNFNAETNHPGMITLTTGTTTTGRTVCSSSSATTSIVLGGGAIRFGSVFIIPTLSDGTNTFTIRTGLTNGGNGDGNYGVYFRYTNGVNGGEWQGVALDGGAETTLDTNTAADTSWHRYEFEITAAGTSVEFFIDGSSVGTISSGLPTVGQTGVTPLAIQKSAGTTARVARIDAFWLFLEFTTPR